jgi:DNA polymerase I
MTWQHNNPLDEVILVDLKNVAYRMHYSHMGLETSDGRPTSVLHGVLVSILGLHRKHPKAGMIFCVDSETNWRMSIKTPKIKVKPDSVVASVRFSNAIANATLSGAYKGNRKFTEDVRKVNIQVPILEKLFRELGFKVINIRGFEADDTIGTLANRLAKHEYGYNRVMIYSNDKDFFQLDLGRIQIIRPLLRGKVERIKTGLDVYNRYSVYPDKWVKYRALCGDTSDNIKHIAGIGPKTAVKLLEAGIDPSLSEFDQHRGDIRRRYSALKDNWSLIHHGYLLSKLLPSKLKWGEFPLVDGIKEHMDMSSFVTELQHATKVPYREFEKSLDEMSDEYLHFLCDYELMYLLSRRHEIWRIK